MKTKHAEVLVQMMEVGLSEQINPARKDDRRSHRETQKIWEPLPTRQIRGNQSYQCPLTGPQFVEDLLNQRKPREGIRLKPVPVLKKGIHSHSYGIVERGKVRWQMIVESGDKEIDHYWPLGL